AARRRGSEQRGRSRTVARARGMTTVGRPTFELPSLVGGEEVFGDARFPVTFPYTGETIGSAPILDRAAVVRALDLAAASATRLDRYARAQVLEAVATRIAGEADELAHMITWESGLALADTRYEVRRATDVFRFAAAEALRDDGAVFA